jgi:hypothetical protein
MGRHIPIPDPTVNRVLADTQMLGYFPQGNPWLILRHLPLPFPSIAELCEQLRTHAENLSAPRIGKAKRIALVFRLTESGAAHG